MLWTCLGKDWLISVGLWHFHYYQKMLPPSHSMAWPTWIWVLGSISLTIILATKPLAIGRCFQAVKFMMTDVPPDTSFYFQWIAQQEPPSGAIWYNRVVCISDNETMQHYFPGWSWVQWCLSACFVQPLIPSIDSFSLLTSRPGANSTNCPISSPIYTLSIPAVDLPGLAVSWQLLMHMGRL